MGIAERLATYGMNRESPADRYRKMRGFREERRVADMESQDKLAQIASKNEAEQRKRGEGFKKTTHEYVMSLDESERAVAYEAALEHGGDIGIDTSGWNQTWSPGTERDLGAQFGPVKEPKETDRKIIKDVNDRSRYEDTGELVFPDVKEEPKEPKEITPSPIRKLQLEKNSLPKGSEDRESLEAMIAKLKAPAATKGKGAKPYTAEQFKDLQLEVDNAKSAMGKIDEVLELQETTKTSGAFGTIMRGVGSVGAYTGLWGSDVKKHDQLIKQLEFQLTGLLGNNPRYTHIIQEAAKISVSRPGIASEEELSTMALNTLKDQLQERHDTMQQSLAKDPRSEQYRKTGEVPPDYVSAPATPGETFQERLNKRLNP